MGRSMKKAYQRLNVVQYTKVIKDTLVPFFDEYDGEFITMLNPNTIFTIRGHYYNGKFFGFNIYADNTLLETKSTLDKAKRYVEKIRRSQEKGE